MTRIPDIIRISDMQHPVKRMLAYAAARLGSTQAELSGPCRSRHLVRARQAVTLAAMRKGYSSTVIAMHMGDRDHSTILAQRKRADAIRDPHFARFVSEIAEAV